MLYLRANWTAELLPTSQKMCGEHHLVRCILLIDYSQEYDTMVEVDYIDQFLFGLRPGFVTIL